jgi:hypothetical protein
MQESNPSSKHLFLSAPALADMAKIARKCPKHHREDESRHLRMACDSDRDLSFCLRPSAGHKIADRAHRWRPSIARMRLPPPCMIVKRDSVRSRNSLGNQRSGLTKLAEIGFGSFVSSHPGVSVWCGGLSALSGCPPCICHHWRMRGANGAGSARCE